MVKLPLEARMYYFACYFLWHVLALFHYLDEEVTKGKIGVLHLRWSTPFENLANWTLEERYFPIDREKIAKDEGEILFSTGDSIGDLLVLRWSAALNAVAIETHKKRPNLDESMWLYYYYCWFLRQVLTEFDGVLRESDNSLLYYKHYQQHVDLFNDMIKALENESPFLDTTNVSEAARQATWDDIDTYASKLGEEWRQAVHSAARDLTLPGFVRNT